jgi:hypothetical protein
MESIELLREFFGWCTLLHFLILMLASIVIAIFKKPVTKLHSRISHLNEKELNRAYFRYLANYKIAFLVFSLAPYAALSLMI